VREGKYRKRWKKQRKSMLRNKGILSWTYSDEKFNMFGYSLAKNT
jgi:hypothetical protein